MMAAASSRTRSSVHSYSRSSFSSASGFAPSSSPFSAARGCGSASAYGFHGHQLPASATRVHLAGASSASVRLSIADRPTSPGRSLSVASPDHQIVKRPLAAQPAASRRRTCMCSPTTHPGSFRCAFHKNAGVRPGRSAAVPPASSRLNARRSAMTNSLVRIGTVEGSDVIRRALAALIRPSSHQQRRRAAFQPRPSRLSIMSKADDLC